jgi:periplasmic divalent cation tolerance protein
MNAAEDIIILYTTLPSLDAAEALGRFLVESSLAACVNIAPAGVSIFRWQGKVERAEEVFMIVKTRKSLQGETMKAIADRHPYETPALLVFDVAVAGDPYKTWLLNETVKP